MLTSEYAPAALSTCHRSRCRLRTQPARILLATDLEDLEHTFPVAAAQARLYGADILVAHVLPDFESPQAAPSLLLLANPENYIRYAEQTLADVVNEARAQGLSVSSRILQGSITEQIEILADEWHADRVVTGCHGLEKFYLRIVGSNAERLFRQTRVPVLGVGPNAHLQPGLGQRTMRVLIPVSFRRKSQFLFRYAAMFSEMDRVDVTVLHVVEESAASRMEAGNLPACESWLRSETKMYADRPGMSCKVKTGSAAEIILETAAQGAFDMVVLGNSSASLFAPGLMASTAYRLLANAPCPVLVVKDEQACSYGC